MSQSLPWTSQAEHNMRADLDLLCAAFLQKDESCRFELKGQVSPDVAAPSKVSSNLRGEGRFGSIADLALKLCRPDRFIPPRIKLAPRYSPDLMIRTCQASDYSAHQRLTAWTALPDRLVAAGLSHNEIAHHLARHTPPDR